jgi:outer membrane receptor for ferrienterochelin and colicins
VNRVQRRHRHSPPRYARTASLVLLACCLKAQPASADPAAQARFHDELARQHYQAKRFEQALREFFLEQRISPNPRIAFNIGLCFQDLSRDEDAFQYFSEYLASDDPDPGRRRYAEQVVQSLRGKLALVRVQSTPSGARIFVDRRELGSYGTTPRLVALPAGEHEVWIELEGHRSASGKVTLEPARELLLELAPERIVGQLRVTSPSAGEVTVKSAAGETLGHGPAPLELSVPPGSYELSVSSPRYLPWSSLAQVEPDQTTTVAALPQLAPEPTGSITVTSNVPGALVEINGEPAGFSPTVLSNVKLGVHELRVHAPNLVPWSGELDVQAEQRSWLTVSLEEPPSSRPSLATWVVGGVGATALATGGILAIVAAQTHADFEDATSAADRRALRERGETLNTAVDVALITGVVALGVATVLYFTTQEVRGRPSSAVTTQGEGPR